MSLPLLKPAPLSQGDRIAVIAPASPFDVDALARGIQKIQHWGFKVEHRADIFSRKRYLAGDDFRRFEELAQALEDPQIKAIFVARGGYGCARLLPLLDTYIPPDSAKIILGYSDISTLLFYVYQRWSWVSFHGPVVAKDMGDRMGLSGEASLLRTLTDPRPLGILQAPSLVTLRGGRVRGPLVGGCLTLVATSLGTPYQLRTENCILYLEDVGELLYSLDRLLTQLRQAGLFRGVRGIVFGPLKDAHDEPAVVQEMLLDVLGDLNVPMVFGFPSGHGDDMWTLPLGLEVTLDADLGQLIFEESALR